MNRCKELTTGLTYFQVTNAIKASLRSYGDMLLSRLPQPVAGSADTYNLAPGAPMLLCQIVNTATYCSETSEQLSENLKRMVDPVFIDHIVFVDVEEFFKFDVVAHTLKALSCGVACLLDVPLNRLKRMNWSTVSDVGDQSEYVVQVSTILQEVVPVIRKKLSELNFISFCEKFVRSFIPRYMAAIYATKTIGEFGAQQLLLDAVAVKSLLLGVPGLCGEDEDLPPIEAPMYAKYVQREVSRLELLLKLVSTPKERFSDSIKTLWPDASAADIQGVMELRGMKRTEQSETLEQLGLTAVKTAGAVPGAASMKGVVNKFQTGASALTESLGFRRGPHGCGARILPAH